MALPLMKKRRRSRKKGILDHILPKETRASRKKTEEKGKERSQTLGGALVKHLAVKPVKLAGGLAASAMIKDIPELGLLALALKSFVSDVGGVLSKNKIHDSKLKENTNKNGEKLLQSMSKAVVGINIIKGELPPIANSIVKQSTVLTNSFGMLGTRLDTLDDIFAELRTLTSITAKVWDVSKKSLTSTRTTNMTEVMKKKNARFDAFNKTEKNKSAEDLQKEEKPIAQKEDKQPSILESIGSSLAGIGSSIMGFVGKLIEGSGFATLMRLTPVALLATLAASMGWREIQQILKTDFSKIGDNISKAFDKDGLMGAVKALFSDKQVQALGEALVKGFHDMFDPILKFIEEIFPQIKKPIEAVKSTAQNLGDAEHRLLDKDAPKQLPVNGREKQDLSKYETPLAKSWEMHDYKKGEEKSKKGFLDSLFSDDTMDMVDAQRKAQGLAPIDSNAKDNIKPAKSARNVANSVVAQQDMATKTDVATTVALQNGGAGSNKSSGNTSFPMNNNTSNSVVINNYGTSTRQSWVDNSISSKQQP